MKADSSDEYVALLRKQRLGLFNNVDNKRLNNYTRN